MRQQVIAFALIGAILAALTYVRVNVLAVTLLGEQLTLRRMAGTAFVLVGIFLVTTSIEVGHGIQ